MDGVSRGPLCTTKPGPRCRRSRESGLRDTWPPPGRLDTGALGVILRPAMTAPDAPAAPTPPAPPPGAPPGPMRLSPLWLAFAALALALPLASLMGRRALEPRLPVLLELPAFTLQDQDAKPFGREQLLG